MTQLSHKKLAIISPSQEVYSETFIHAHKNLPYPIRFYYGGFLPTQLEGGNGALKCGLIDRVKTKVFGKFGISEYALLKSLKKENIGCVLAEYGPTGCECLKVIKSLGLPLIVHFHGFDASEISALNKYGKQYLEVFHYAKLVIVVSKKMRQKVLELGCSPAKILLSTYGPNPLFFENTPKYKKLQFISVGRFVQKKAPHLTILAFKKVSDKYSDAKMIMVGDGALLPLCKDLSIGLGIADKIDFKGVVSPVGVAKLFEESLAFVQHSIVADNGDSEGTPVAVIEAQAAALPVISTYHGGIPDIVIHSQTGFLVGERDVLQMSAYMCKIIEDSELAQELGNNGRKNILNFFTLEKHLMNLEGAITQFL